MQLFEKLAHPLPEVRHRTLRNLQFKLQHGLLDAIVATADPGALGLEHLLSFFSLDVEPANALVVLELLCAISRHAAVAVHLLRLRIDQVLLQLADAISECTQPATALLGELLCQHKAEAALLCGSDSSSGSVQKPEEQSPWQASNWRVAAQRAPGWPSPAPSLPCLIAAKVPAAHITPRSPAVPPEDVLASWGRRARSTQLAAEDSQQLFELALDLKEGVELAAGGQALVAAVSTLRRGVLSDMPAPAVAGEPALMQGLHVLLASDRTQPHSTAAALQALHVIADGLAAADDAAEGEPGLDLAPIAGQALLRCAPLLTHNGLQHEALPAAMALVLLLAPSPNATPNAGSAVGSALSPLLEAFTEALHLSMVEDCGAAGLVPPEDWEPAFHAVTLGLGSYGIVKLVMCLLQQVPQLVSAETLPAPLCSMLAALASSPGVACAAPDVRAFAEHCLLVVRPDVAKQLREAAELQMWRSKLLAAVEQLASAANPALAAACCREVQHQLVALQVLDEAECGQAVASSVVAACRHPAAAPAAQLTAALLQHHEAHVRQAALSAMCRAWEQQLDVTALLLHPGVVGSLMLGLEDEPARQQLAAELLQAAAQAASVSGMRQQRPDAVFLPWELWLRCQSGSSVVRQAVSSVLQLAEAEKRTTWQHLQPLLTALFSTSPAVAAEAAGQLYAFLVQQQGTDEASGMLFNQLPFDGMLLAAGDAGCAAASHGRCDPGRAAALFTAADVHSLLSVIANASLPPELTAAALGQLAQVACDERFAAILTSETVLATLVAHAQDSSPFSHAQQAALDTVVSLLEHQASTADWLLANPDSHMLPLLPLVFHALPVRRHAAAKILHYLLFVAAARQLHRAIVHKDGSRCSTGAGALGAPGQPTWHSMPAPICALFHFPYPTAAVTVARSMHPQPPPSVFKSQHVQRLWRSQQFCQAVSSGAGNSGHSAGQVQGFGTLPAPLSGWEEELVQSLQATTRGLDVELQVAEGLQALSCSQNHVQCLAALRRLKLLLAVKGSTALAASAWQDCLGFLLTAAPLSDEDCVLWLEMLPLVQRLLSEAAAHGQQDRVLVLAEQFAAGSAFTWVQQQCPEAHSVHVRAALLPVVLDTVRVLAEQGRLLGSPRARQRFLAAMRSQDWLTLLCQQLQQGGYAGRVASLQLMAVLTAAQVGVDCDAGPAVASMVAVQRSVLMPRHLWSTGHLHGKAAVLAAFGVLNNITRAVAVEQWAPEWADGVGTTYWLSRAAADSNPVLRQLAFQLLAAAVAAPHTNRLLQQAWPECGGVAVKAAMSDAQPEAVRAAATSVVAAAVSHGPLGRHAEEVQGQGLSVLLPGHQQKQREEEARDQEQQSEVQAQKQQQKEEAEVEGPQLDGQPQQFPQPQEREEGQQQEKQDSMAAVDVAPLSMAPDAVAPGAMQLVAACPPPRSMDAAHLLGCEELWSCLQTILQTILQESTEPGLVSAAALAVLQRGMLEADALCQVSSAVLQRLLGMPAAVAEDAGFLKSGGMIGGEDALNELPTTATHSLQQAVQAAHAAAGMVAVMCACNVPGEGGSHSSLNSNLDLLCSVSSALSLTAAISMLPEACKPAVLTLQLRSQAALAPLADAAALLLQAAEHKPEQVQAACSCHPLPLSAAVAAALACTQQAELYWPQKLVSSCRRLLAAVLSEAAWAHAFLLADSGEEHRVAAGCINGSTDPSAAEGQPVGAALCMHLMEHFLASAPTATPVGASDSDGQQRLLEHAALGRLLAHSHPAKQVAVEVGFHVLLLNSCRSLAAGLHQPQEAPAEGVPPATTASPSRAAPSKLQQLKKLRRGGAAARGGSNKPAPAQLAFGSRLPTTSAVGGDRSSRTQHTSNSCAQPGMAQEGASEGGGRGPGSEAPCAAAAEQGTAEVIQGQPAAAGSGTAADQLLPWLALLQQLGLESDSSCDSLTAEGLLDAAAGMWGCGGPLVQRSLLSLLATALACSGKARQALAATGSPPLLERLTSLVLSPGRATAPTVAAAATALGCYAASPDGCRMLVHSTAFPTRALRSLQDSVASKDWRRLAPALQVLADLCSQPEGQRALLRCSTPSEDMLGVLLGLAGQQHSSAAAAAEAAMRVLRQVALCPDAKAHLVARHGALQQLVDAVAAAEQQPGRAAAAAQALWGLVSGGERVKVAVRRCEGWAEGVQAGLRACRRGSQVATWRQPLWQACEALQQLLA